MVITENNHEKVSVRAFCDRHHCTIEDIAHVLHSTTRTAYSHYMGSTPITREQLSQLQHAHEQWCAYEDEVKTYLTYEHDTLPKKPTSMRQSHAMRIVERLVNSRWFDADKSIDSSDRIILLLDSVTPRDTKNTR